MTTQGRLLWAILVFGLAGCGEQPEGWRLSDGSALGGEQLQDKVIFINYWAEWCQPCREEIPHLNRLAKQPNVLVIGVNFDGEQGDPLARAMGRLGIEFPVASDDVGAQWLQQRPAGLPTTLVIDRNSQLRMTLLGPQTGDTLREALQVVENRGTF